MFQVCLYTIPPTDLFNAFAETLGVRYDIVTLDFTLLVADWVPAVLWLLTPPETSPVDLVSLFSSLFKAHLRYLKLARAFLRCSISFGGSLGLLQTVLALWVRVLMML